MFEAGASHKQNWTILIQLLEGFGAQSQAAHLINRLRQLEVSDVWIKEVGGKHYVLRGQYPDATTPEVHDHLRQLRTMVQDKSNPFSLAEIIPLNQLSQNASDLLDVRRFKGQWPYTLQVAVFDENYGSRRSRSRAAEDLTRELRGQGHRSFYYHLERSMVTVGLFSDDDRVPQTVELPSGTKSTQWAYGPRIKLIQNVFPHNLVNGEVYLVDLPTGKQLPQPSNLIPIK